MTYGGVFWYGLAIIVLSAVAGATQGNVIDVVFTVAINWLVLVLPVILIRNARTRRKTRATA